MLKVHHANETLTAGSKMVGFDQFAVLRAYSAYRMRMACTPSGLRRPLL
jgi:hypothetical protein